jgi:hypothetical protein
VLVLYDSKSIRVKSWPNIYIYIYIYISIGEALKLFSPYKRDKRKVLAFISNVDTALEVINPENPDVKYKFVLTRISGEPRVARNLENWDDLRTFMKHANTEKRTLVFHATQLYGARQGKNVSISECIQNIQYLVQNSWR